MIQNDTSPVPLSVPENNLYLHNQRLGLIQVHDGVRWENDFFQHQFNTKDFRDAVQETASGVKVRHTYPKKLQAIEVQYPTKLSEQKKIASHLNELNGKVQDLKSIYEKKLLSLEELKLSILQKAFTGELMAKTVDKIMEPV